MVIFIPLHIVFICNFRIGRRNVLDDDYQKKLTMHSNKQQQKASQPSTIQNFVLILSSVTLMITTFNIIQTFPIHSFV